MPLTWITEKGSVASVCSKICAGAEKRPCSQLSHFASGQINSSNMPILVTSQHKGSHQGNVWPVRRTSITSVLASSKVLALAHSKSRPTDQILWCCKKCALTANGCESLLLITFPVNHGQTPSLFSAGYHKCLLIKHLLLGKS